MNKCVRGNPNLCMGCRTCLIACVEAHCDRPVFELKPEDICFNPKLHMIKSYDVTVPFQCRHCETPECMKVCKKGAIYHDEDRILIDFDKCDGCGECKDACPFGAIDMTYHYGVTDEDGNGKLLPNKCDLCKNVPGGPQCVNVCPTQALSVVENSDIEQKVMDKRLGKLLKESNDR